MSSKPHPSGQINIMSMQTLYKWDMNESICFTCTNPGDRLVSPTFSFNELQWRLVLYPNGNDQENEGYLSIFLKSDNAIKVRVFFVVSIQIDSNDYTSASSEEYLTFGPNIAKGFPRFFSNESLPSKFSVSIEIQIDEASLIEIKNSKLQPNISESARIEEVCKVDGFENLLNNQKYSDFKFIIDGKELYVHKSILTGRSKHFERMFEHEIRNEDTIVDIEYEVFCELLRFLYTGKISEFNKYAADLFIVANKYDLQGLKSACEKKICENINIDNVIDIIKLADLYHGEELKKKAIKFTGLHRDLMEKPEFKSSLTILRPDLMYEIMYGFVKHQGPCKKIK